MKYLLRGDATGSICVWRVPDTPECAALQAKAEGAGECEKLTVVSTKSLSTSWDHASPHPVGVLDQLDENMNSAVVESSSTPALTSHIFLPSQCRLVIGREDGSIVMVPATQTIMLHLLSGRHHKYTTWPSHQVLIGNKELSILIKKTNTNIISAGHTGRVNCLLYPNNSNPRYDMAHLVSGGIDFSVCLWDIYTGTLLHRFSCHGGEVGGGKEEEILHLNLNNSRC